MEELYSENYHKENLVDQLKHQIIRTIKRIIKIIRKITETTEIIKQQLRKTIEKQREIKPKLTN